MYCVQHEVRGGWESFRDPDGEMRQFPQFLDATAWIGDFIFAATSEMFQGVRHPEDGYDATKFRIVDIEKNEVYQMTAEHRFRRQSDHILFDLAGDTVTETSGDTRVPAGSPRVKSHP
jgi:hypothetical protein